MAWQLGDLASMLPLLYLILIYSDIDVVSSQGVLHSPYTGGQLDCPTSESVWLEGPQIPWGVEYRAYKTIPPSVTLEISPIKGAGYGIISNVFIPAFTWLAEYEGEIWVASSDDEPDISWYAWSTYREGEFSHYVEAFNIEMSNWVRWINCARTPDEENVVANECRGRIYYMTTKDVHPGQELLVYYGESYAKTLEIDYKLWHDG